METFVKNAFSIKPRCPRARCSHSAVQEATLRVLVKHPHADVHISSGCFTVDPGWGPQMVQGPLTPPLITGLWEAGAHIPCGETGQGEAVMMSQTMPLAGRQAGMLSGVIADFQRLRVCLGALEEGSHNCPAGLSPETCTE
jgi:hypothetical protein